MNVLVDTNVLISAVIRDRLPQRVIDEIVSRDDWFWIISAGIETAKFRQPFDLQHCMAKRKGRRS